MIEIEAFRGVRYNDELKDRMEKLITLPYDKINENKKEEYIKKDPYNFVRIILNEHDEAKKTLTEWMKKDILIREEKPSFYFYIQEFFHPYTQKSLKRKGIITLLKIEDFGKNIFPHEKILDKPKIDRLNLIRKTQANLGQIFMLYKDKENIIIPQIEHFLREVKPIYDFLDETNHHNLLWRIDDEDLIKMIKELFKEKKLFIADGHHRYEVSNIYRKEMKDKLNTFSFPETPEYVMVTLVNAYNNGIVILPTHRAVKIKNNVKKVLKKWESYFQIEEIYGEKKLRELMSNEKKNHVIGLYMDNRYMLMKPYMDKIKEFFDLSKSKRWNLLDVNILHRSIIDNLEVEDIKFFREWHEGIEIANQDIENSMCFFLNPTEISDVLDIAKNLEKMPQKSTDFYPKLPSGLILNKMRLKEQE